MQGFLLKYKNACKCIEQINNGEWATSTFVINGIYQSAYRNGRELCLSNGAWYCDIFEPAPHFGIFWRHFVWWRAARKLSKIKTPVLE